MTVVLQKSIRERELIESCSTSWGERLKQLQPPSPYGPEIPMVLPAPPPATVTLMVVGEAPGHVEEKQGEFFVGRAGQLLRGILKDEGAINQTYFTNASFWRPPRGEGTAGDERPGVAVLRSQFPRLLFEILSVAPPAILAVGASAAQALGASELHRGEVLFVRAGGYDYPVFVTWHPAYVLREAKFYSDLAVDIQRAVRKDIPNTAEGSYVLATEPVNFVGRYCSIDCETTSTSPSADLICTAVRDQERTYLFEPRYLPALRESMAKFRGRVLGHNSKFDESILRRHGVGVTFHHDSLLLHLALDNRRGTHSLKTLSPVYGKRATLENTVAPFMKNDAENVWGGIPKEILYAYCAADAVSTADTFTSLVRLTDWRERRLYNFLRRAARPIAEGEYKGILVDREALHVALEDQRRKVAEMHDNFVFDPDSPAQTVAALNREGYRIISSAGGVLNRLEGELPSRILEYREQSKIVKSFLLPLDQQWIGPDGICHARTLIHGTDTGRTSMESPNLQQVPMGLRGFFIPRKDCTFIGWDLRNNEVRCLAVLSGDKDLIRMLNDNRDPHQEVADVIGVQRKTAKNFLFGTVYSASLKKLSETAQVDIDTTRRGVAAIKEMFPGLAEWRVRAIREAREKGYVETCFGRRISFPYWDSRNQYRLERQICNGLPQSMGSDVGLISVVRAWETFNLPCLVFVHDSVLVEVKTDQMQKVMEGLKEILTNLYPNQYGVRFEVDIRFGNSWRDLNA